MTSDTAVSTSLYVSASSSLQTFTVKHVTLSRDICISRTIPKGSCRYHNARQSSILTGTREHLHTVAASRIECVACVESPAYYFHGLSTCAKHALASSSSTTTRCTSGSPDTASIAYTQLSEHALARHNLPCGIAAFEFQEEDRIRKSQESGAKLGFNVRLEYHGLSLECHKEIAAGVMAWREEVNILDKDRTIFKNKQDLIGVDKILRTLTEENTGLFK